MLRDEVNQVKAIAREIAKEEIALALKKLDVPDTVQLAAADAKAEEAPAPSITTKKKPKKQSF